MILPFRVTLYLVDSWFPTKRIQGWSKIEPSHGAAITLYTQGGVEVSTFQPEDILSFNFAPTEA